MSESPIDFPDRQSQPPQPPSPGASPEAAPDSAQVQEWVARFRDPLGPPRIGARALDEPAPAPLGYASEPATRRRDEVADRPDPSLSRRLEIHAPALQRRISRRIPPSWGLGVAAAVVLGVAAILMAQRNDVGPQRGHVRASAATSSRQASEPLPGALVPPVSAPSARRATAAAGPRAGALDADSRAARTESASRRYGIEVGTFINEDRAIEERDRLAESTRLRSRLRTTTKDGVAEYHVLVGSFEDAESAERAAEELIARGIVDQARVVGVGRRSLQRRR